MSRRYHVLDVFTDAPLAGNQLAVVTEAAGLDTERMQAIAREFNLSETVFVLPPQDDRHRAHLRIFTPGSELPFAGHPTVGTAVLLALLDGRGTASAFGLEEGVGVVPCVAEPRGPRSGYARFRLPKLPAVVGAARARADYAAALGLAPEEIGFGRHVPSVRAVGGAFHLIPVASREALARARPAAAFDAVITGDHAAVFVYAASDTGYRARMFGPGIGIAEDPATGSAVACLAGAIADHDNLANGAHDILIDQGVEMGRPSRIELQVHIEGGRLAGAEIGGGAVIVAEGVLHA